MTKLVSLLSDEASYMAMNVLYYDEESKKKVFEAIKTHVKDKVDKIAFLEVEDWSNKVFVMSKDKKVKND